MIRNFEHDTLLLRSYSIFRSKIIIYKIGPFVMALISNCFFKQTYVSADCNGIFYDIK